jgi:hypothetical protein
MAWNLCRVCDIAVGLKIIMPSRMLKQSANLSCSFDLFGLSGLSRVIGLFGLSCVFG